MADSLSSSEEEDRKKKRRRRRRHDDDDDDNDRKREYSSGDDEQDSRDRKRRKKSKQKKSKKRSKHHSSKRRDYSSSDDSDSSSDDYSSDDSHDRKRRRKSKKKSKKSKKKKRSSRKEGKISLSPPSFGKYGVVKSTDMSAKQRSFEIWMAEIKGIPSFTGSKWELQEYFKEYAEDFNTATLPHKKYYDYDKWEMVEYQRQKEEEQVKMSSSNSMLADEARHQADMRKRTEEKRQEEMKFLRETMNSDKIAGMKRQKDLEAELQHAYKTGDKERVQRIKQKLEPDEKR